MSAVISFFRPARVTGGDWSQQELAEFYRVEAALIRAGMRITSEQGLSDEADPWFVFCKPDGDAIIHFARIDGNYVVASDALDRPLYGSDFRALLNQIAEQYPTFLPIPQSGVGTKLVVHPAALLAAIVAAAALSLSPEDAVAGELNAIGRAPAGPPVGSMTGGQPIAAPSSPARASSSETSETDNHRKQFEAIVFSAMIFAVQALSADAIDKGLDRGLSLSDPMSHGAGHLAQGEVTLSQASAASFGRAETPARPLATVLNVENGSGGHDGATLSISGSMASIQATKPDGGPNGGATLRAERAHSSVGGESQSVAARNGEPGTATGESGASTSGNGAQDGTGSATTPESGTAAAETDGFDRSGENRGHQDHDQAPSSPAAQGYSAQNAKLGPAPRSDDERSPSSSEHGRAKGRDAAAEDAGDGRDSEGRGSNGHGPRDQNAHAARSDDEKGADGATRSTTADRAETVDERSGKQGNSNSGRNESSAPRASDEVESHGSGGSGQNRQNGKMAVESSDSAGGSSVQHSDTGSNRDRATGSGSDADRASSADASPVRGNGGQDTAGLDDQEVNPPPKGQSVEGHGNGRTATPAQALQAESATTDPVQPQAEGGTDGHRGNGRASRTASDHDAADHHSRTDATESEAAGQPDSVIGRDTNAAANRSSSPEASRAESATSDPTEQQLDGGAQGHRGHGAASATARDHQPTDHASQADATESHSPGQPESVAGRNALTAVDSAPQQHGSRAEHVAADTGQTHADGGDAQPHRGNGAASVLTDHGRADHHSQADAAGEGSPGQPGGGGGGGPLAEANTPASPQASRANGTAPDVAQPQADAGQTPGHHGNGAASANSDQRSADPHRHVEASPGSEAVGSGAAGQSGSTAHAQMPPSSRDMSATRPGTPEAQPSHDAHAPSRGATPAASVDTDGNLVFGQGNGHQNTAAPEHPFGEVDVHPDVGLVGLSTHTVPVHHPDHH